MAGINFAFNDKDSLSGYLIMLIYLQDNGKNARRYFNWMKSGAHSMSVQWLLNGLVDGACVDYLVWRNLIRDRPEILERLEIIERIGPYPIQPLILNVKKMDLMGTHLRDVVKEAFRVFCNNDELNLRLFKKDGFERFIALNYEDDYLKLGERIEMLKKSEEIEI